MVFARRSPGNRRVRAEGVRTIDIGGNRQRKGADESSRRQRRWPLPFNPCVYRDKAIPSPDHICPRPPMIPLSFEFYPPKTDEQRAQLDRTAKKIKAHAPEYVSCTFGAGGSTLDYTPETIDRLHARHGLDAAPHISCVGGTRAEIDALLRRYRDMGCR